MFQGFTTKLNFQDKLYPTKQAGLDADAKLFINAAGITDQTQINAIDNLVKQLKLYSIWNKMKAIYPFIGATANTHKFNLRNPQDTDAAFRLVFNGGWTHSLTGALPNGTNAYADTRLIPSTSLLLNSTHLSYYSRTNTSVNSAEIGSSATNGLSPYLLLQLRTASNLLVAHINDNSGSTTVSNTDGTGYYIGNRTASNVKTTFKNGVKVINDTYASSSLNLNAIYIGAYNSNSASLAYSNKECAFATIGDGLEDAEAINLYMIIQNYQSALNRQV